MAIPVNIIYLEEVECHLFSNLPIMEIKFLNLSPLNKEYPPPEKNWHYMYTPSIC